MRVEILIGALLGIALVASIELFLKIEPSALLELVKLVVQFGGAMLIAWFTVRWALDRFKTEKMWERRTTALADVLSALREMLRVLEHWEEKEIRGAEYSQEFDEKLRDRYQKAKQKFEEVSAVAIMLLPQEAADRIETLEATLANGQYDSWFEEINAESAAIAEALAWLVDHAKEYRL
jgi:hypothetical protein